MTKEFILKSLLPYKENPETCGYDGSNCAYLTTDNKKCAIGQYMKEGEWQHIQCGVEALFQKFPPKDMMSEEWLEQNIPTIVASAMQGYHDVLAEKKICSEYYTNRLEHYTGFKLNELK